MELSKRHLLAELMQQRQSCDCILLAAALPFGVSTVTLVLFRPYINIFWLLLLPFFFFRIAIIITSSHPIVHHPSSIHTRSTTIQHSRSADTDRAPPSA